MSKLRSLDAYKRRYFPNAYEQEQIDQLSLSDLGKLKAAKILAQIKKAKP